MEDLEKRKPGQMTTLTEVLERLRVKKLDKEFLMTEQGFTPGNGKYYNPENLKIIQSYRFEGESDPGDNCVLYVLEAHDGSMGYTIDSYGVYTNHDDKYDEFITKVQVENRDEQMIF